MHYDIKTQNINCFVQRRRWKWHINWITSLKLDFLFWKLATSTKLLLTSLSHIVFWILHKWGRRNVERQKYNENGTLCICGFVKDKKINAKMIDLPKIINFRDVHPIQIFCRKKIFIVHCILVLRQRSFTMWKLFHWHFDNKLYDLRILKSAFGPIKLLVFMINNNNNAL